MKIILLLLFNFSLIVSIAQVTCIDTYLMHSDYDDVLEFYNSPQCDTVIEYSLKEIGTLGLTIVAQNDSMYNVELYIYYGYYCPYKYLGTGWVKKELPLRLCQIHIIYEHNNKHSSSYYYEKQDLQVVYYEDKWIKVKNHNNKEGWIYDELVMCAHLPYQCLDTIVFYSSPDVNTSSVIKKLNNTPSEDFYIFFRILSQNDSMYEVIVNDTRTSEKIKGWVTKKIPLSTGVESISRLFESPTHSSKIILELDEFSNLYDNGITLLEIKDSWVRISCVKEGKEYIGWLPREMQCCYHVCN